MNEDINKTEELQVPGLTLLDLTIELLLSVNKGSGGKLDGDDIIAIVERELQWMDEQNIITLPPMEENDGI